MSSSTRNVKLGVCKITFGGTDLGLTKGGVDVTVATQTHAVQVDQFGQSSVNEYIMGRTCVAKVPLAETTLENLVTTTPGSTLVTIPGTKASASFAFSAQPVANDTITVNGLQVKFVAAGPVGNQVLIGAALTNTLTSLVAFFQASTDAHVANLFTYGSTASNFTVTAVDDGVFANTAYTVAKVSANVTVTPFAGGVDAKKRADVTSGVGISLLSIAKMLRFHPIANAANDVSEDFVMPLAMCAGDLQFAYKVDAERIYNASFSAYPDPATKLLFYVGDEAAG